MATVWARPTNAKETTMLTVRGIATSAGSADIVERRARRNERAMALFDQARQADAEEREVILQRIVIDYLDLARAIARRYAGRSEEAGDIRQVSYVGLVKAAHRFDSTRAGDFASFAVPTIAGEIKRHLRDNGWFVRPPRHIQELHNTLRAEIPRLAQELGHSPAARDIARTLDESVDAVSEALGCGASLHPVSLDITVHDDDTITLADTIGGVDRGLERAELAATLRSVCTRLTLRERRILYLRFIREQSQSEIARELNVTQMQVSRLLSQILGKLRDELSADLVSA
jgi:RNA polymerase sigma-B factor